MEITKKELRMKSGKIIDQVANGIEITVTYRGKPLAKIVPIKTKTKLKKHGSLSIFGLWKNRDDINDVDVYVRKIRKGRKF